MEAFTLLLPLLFLGNTMAQGTQSPNNTAFASALTTTNMNFQVDSLIQCLIDPKCDVPTSTGAAQAAIITHSSFVTTTAFHGNNVTLEVTPTSEPGHGSGFLVNMHEGHGPTQKCSAASKVPFIMHCDPPPSPHHHIAKLAPGTSKAMFIEEVLLAVLLGIVAILAFLTCCCLLLGRRSRRQRAGRTSTDLPGQEITEVTRTTQNTTNAGALGRVAEEGRSAAPLTGALAANSITNAGHGGSGANSEIGHAIGQGTGAAVTGTGAAAEAAQQGIGHGAGAGSTSVASADHTGSEIVDGGSMRGRRTLRGGNQQKVVA